MYLSVLENENTFTALEVLSIVSRFINGPPTDADFAVGTVATQDGDLGRTNALFHQDAPLFESQRSGVCNARLEEVENKNETSTSASASRDRHR